MDERLAQRLAATLARTVPGGTAEEEQVEPLRLLVGQVTAVPVSGATVTVTTDGVHDRVDVPALYHPAVNDVVWVLEQPPLLLVLGVTASW